MTGEKLAWFQLASHLGIPVGELKQRITFSEFRDWLRYLEWNESRHEKLDFYLAQIAAEVRRGLVKDPKKVKLRDLLLEVRKPVKTPLGMSSKQIWLMALGVKH